jgi:hypothetical protein
VGGRKRLAATTSPRVVLLSKQLLRSLPDDAASKIEPIDYANHHDDPKQGLGPGVHANEEINFVAPI